jgi:CheY-like chemotaxis protein
MGMTSETVDKLFGKFVQADASTTRRFGGTGLGLAICRDLVEIMGGRLSVESSLGRGSRFVFSLPLPLVRDAVTRSPEPSASVDRSGSLRILAAEDNQINQRVLEAFLGTAGYTAVFVETGVEAVKAWSGENWDMILMDVQMPVMDGTEATAIIRQRETEQGRARTPIVALTANAMSHQAAEYLALGMDAVVPKPIEAKNLLETIARVAAANQKANPVPLARTA